MMRTSLMARVCFQILVLLTVGCSESDKGNIPPGPWNAVESFRLHDSFAARVEREGQEAAWRRATDPTASPYPRRFGLRPLIYLTNNEVEALRSQLADEEQLRALAVIHDLAIEKQASTQEEMNMLLANILKIRVRRPVNEELGLLPAISAGQTLTEESDEETRKRAWLAEREQAVRLAPLLVKLAKTRNEWAERRHRTKFLPLIRIHRGYDTVVADRLRRQVQRALVLTPGSELQDPWNVEAADPALAARIAKILDAAGCLRRAKEVLTLVGLSESPPGLKIVISEGSGFSDFATFAVNPPSDVRMTFLPGAGIFPHWSSFHEFGHVAQALLAPTKGAFVLRRPASAAVSESCAKTAERLVYAAEWLERQGVKEADISAMASWERVSERARMRDILADLEFEEVFYDNPDGDLNAQFIRIQAKTAGVRAVENIPSWAGQRHLAFEPLARFDYLLARCAQAAIYRRLRSLRGGLLGDEARRVWREDVFVFAAGHRFEEWFEKAAGEPPNCTAWIEDVLRP